MKLLLIMVTLFFTAPTFAQKKIETKEYYLNKSRKQKTIGYILEGTGAALIISGLIVGNGDKNNDPNELDFGPNFDVGLWLIGGGLACGAAGIPFFISSGNNARKAATISWGHQKIIIPQLKKAQIALYQPAIILKIPLYNN